MRVMPWKTDLSIYEITWNLRQLYEQLLDIMQYVCETFRANCFLNSDLLCITIYLVLQLSAPLPP